MQLEQCVILIGGQDAQLDEPTLTCPKPLLPLGGRPFLDVLLWHLERFGFKRVIFSVAHEDDAVETYACSARDRYRLELKVVAVPASRGTAGALRHVLPDTDARFILMNGDTLFDFNLLDLTPFIDAHQNAAIAMALRPLDQVSRFGVVDLDGSKIMGFRERGNAPGGLVKGGVYLVDRTRLGDLPLEGSLERDVLLRLALAGRLYGRAYSGFFLDVGSPSAYAAAERLIGESLSRPAVFFDRDGVLNVDHGYVGTADRFEWTKSAIAAVKAVNDKGWFAFLVTNQAGIARGYYTEADVEALHREMQNGLREQGAHLDDIRFCPYHPEGIIDRFRSKSSWRKPEPGMILDLLARYPVLKDRSILVGDKPSDMEAASRAGIRGVFFDGNDLEATLARQFGAT